MYTVSVNLLICELTNQHIIYSCILLIEPSDFAAVSAASKFLQWWRTSLMSKIDCLTGLKVSNCLSIYPKMWKRITCIHTIPQDMNMKWMSWPRIELGLLISFSVLLQLKRDKEDNNWNTVGKTMIVRIQIGSNHPGNYNKIFCDIPIYKIKLLYGASYCPIITSQFRIHSVLCTWNSFEEYEGEFRFPVAESKNKKENKCKKKKKNQIERGGE